MEVFLAVAEVGVENLVDVDRDEVHAHLARRRARHQGLAAAGRAVEQQGAAAFLAVGLEEVGALLGVERLHAHLFLQIVHAAHVGEVNLGLLDLGKAEEGIGAKVGDILVKAVVEGKVVVAVFHVPRHLHVGLDAGGRLARGLEQLAKVLVQAGVRDGRVQHQGALVVLQGLRLVVLTEVDAAQKQVRGGKVGVVLQDALGPHGGLGSAALQEEGLREAQLRVLVIGIAVQDALVGGLRLREAQFLGGSLRVEQK